MKYVPSGVDFVSQVRWSTRDAEDAVAQLEQCQRELMSARQNTDVEISKASIIIISTFSMLLLILLLQKIFTCSCIALVDQFRYGVTER